MLDGASSYWDELGECPVGRDLAVSSFSATTLNGTAHVNEIHDHVTAQSE